MEPYEGSTSSHGEFTQTGVFIAKQKDVDTTDAFLFSDPKQEKQCKKRKEERG